jgi:hypothetical protein
MERRCNFLFYMNGVEEKFYTASTEGAIYLKFQKLSICTSHKHKVFLLSVSFAVNKRVACSQYVHLI